ERGEDFWDPNERGCRRLRRDRYRLFRWRGTYKSDMLLRNTAGTFEVYDISNNRITNAASLGAVGTAYTTIGFGNFSSLGETDMLMRTLPSGQIQVYDIKNNQITGSASLGAIGAVWLTAGISNHGSESDLVERNSSTGGFEIYDINSNRITNAA